MEKDTKKKLAAASGVAAAAGFGAGAATAATINGTHDDPVRDTTDDAAGAVAKEGNEPDKATHVDRVINETDIVVNTEAGNDVTSGNTTLEEARNILEEVTSNEEIHNPPFIMRPEPDEPITMMYAGPMDPIWYPEGEYGPYGPDYPEDPYAVNPDNPAGIVEPENPAANGEPDIFIENVYAGPMPPEILDPEMPDGPLEYNIHDNPYVSPFDESSSGDAAPSDSDAGFGDDMDFQGDL